MAEIGGGASSGLTGWVRVADVTPQALGDVVDSKTYQDAAHTILQSCRSSTLAVTVTVKSAFPRITIGSTTVEIPEAPDGGHYVGDVDVTLDAPGTIQVGSTTPDGGSGARDNFTLTYVAVPALTALSFTAGYPGAQTELKAGDLFNLTGTVDKNMDAVEVLDQDAGTSQVIAIPTGTSFTVAITIADRGDTVQALPAHVRVRDAVTGAYSLPRSTNEMGGAVNGTDIVYCNNLHPTIAIGAITYPGVQEALKDAEIATVGHTVTNANAVAYDDPTGQLTITSPALYQAPKTVQRLSGSYNVATPNLRIVATRTANAAVTTDYSTVVQIAHTAPVIQVSTATARLRSGGNDGTAVQNHVITLQSDQRLLSAPSLDADSGGARGAFTGSWAGGPSTYTRTLLVSEVTPDEKGTFAWEGLVATGLAGRVQNSVGTGGAYTLGGFVPRTVAWDAFQTVSRAVNVEISDWSKVSAALWSATNQQSIRQVLGTAPPVTDGYTASAIGVTPHTVTWLDTSAAASNSGEAYLYSYQEAV